MKRLSYQIYLTIILCLVAVVVIAGIFWNRAGGATHARQAFGVAGELAGAALPKAGASKSAQADALNAYAKRLDIELALFTRSRELIVSTSANRMPRPPRDGSRSGFMYRRGAPAWAIALPDGRWLVARSSRGHAHRPGLRLIAFLAAIALVVGLGAWPVVRGLTRRLERLQTGVEKLGAGDLTARVDVNGRDEIARLAMSFNGAAARIEELVTSHKMLLANASHEFRTPLSRIRLGIEMLAQKPDKVRQEGIATDINELDGLIEEILLLSRLDARHELEENEPFDLLALVAEEAAKYRDCETGGSSVNVDGSARLVRRLVRNLLDNATKHGSAPIRVQVDRRGDMAVLRVCDSGPGIPPTHRETVFEPFHRGVTQGTTAGTGLGLALVRQIAQRHEGSVRVVEDAKSSRLNCFEVSIPIHRA